MKTYTAVVVSDYYYDGGSETTIQVVEAESPVHAKSYAEARHKVDTNGHGDNVDVVFMVEGTPQNLALEEVQAYRVSASVIVVDGVQYQKVG